MEFLLSDFSMIFGQDYFVMNAKRLVWDIMSRIKAKEGQFDTVDNNRLVGLFKGMDRCQGEEIIKGQS